MRDFLGNVLFMSLLPFKMKFLLAILFHHYICLALETFSYEPFCSYKKNTCTFELILVEHLK